MGHFVAGEEMGHFVAGTICRMGRKWDILSSGTICRPKNAGGTICRWDKMSPNRFLSVNPYGRSDHKNTFFLILPLQPERFFSTLFVKVWLDPPRLLSSVNPSPQMTLIKIVSTHHLPYNLSSHTYIKLEEQFKEKSLSKLFKKTKQVSSKCG